MYTHSTAPLNQAPVDARTLRPVPSADALSSYFRYSEDVIRRGLEHYEHLQALSQGTHFLRHHNSLQDHTEDLLCLYLDLKHAVPMLPLRQRKAVVLHLVLGKTEAEAAAELGITRKALSKRIAAGVTNLRKLLNSFEHPLRDRGEVVPLRRAAGLLHERPAADSAPEPDGRDSLDRGSHLPGSAFL